MCTRFTYGAWWCLWSHAQHSSKQCRVWSRAISKGISKGIPQETRMCCWIQWCLFEPQLQGLTLGQHLWVLPNMKRWAGISNAKWLCSMLEHNFKRPVATEHGWAVISSAKHTLCSVFECCWHGFPPFSRWMRWRIYYIMYVYIYSIYPFKFKGPIR